MSIDKSALRRSMLRWFDRHARDLPWRQTDDPYAIWVSEVMLQQTQVATVKPYFRRFIKRFPDIVALANAEQTEVLKLWEGLGYYRRAKQLHAAAQVVRDRHLGSFPTDVSDVMALPGIGRYTAGAVLSIALNQRLPILEGNTIRVYCRLLGYPDDPHSTAGQRVLWEFAEQILPRKRVGQFNQAMMELGSEICVPRDPACERCPVMRLCPTRQQGLQASIPARKRRLKYESVRESAVIVKRDGRCLIRKCGDNERWAGLWDFPRTSAPATRNRRPANGDAIERHVRDLTGIDIELGSPLTTIKHAVTRFRITLTCYDAVYVRGQLRPGSNCRWVNYTELTDYPLSATGRKIADLSQTMADE